MTIEVKQRDKVQFEKEQAYKFLLDILSQVLELSEEIQTFLLQFVSLDEMEVKEK